MKMSLKSGEATKATTSHTKNAHTRAQKALNTVGIHYNYIKNIN